MPWFMYPMLESTAWKPYPSQQQISIWPIWPCHTAAILSWETKKALFYQSLNPMVSTARLSMVKQSFSGLLGQYDRRVTRGNIWQYAPPGSGPKPIYACKHRFYSFINLCLHKTYHLYNLINNVAISSLDPSWVHIQMNRVPVSIG